MDTNYCFNGYIPNEIIFNEILKYCYIKKYQKNSFIIRQGDVNNKNLYLLLDGTVEVSRISNCGTKLILGHYKKRVCFGESALSGLPRYVSVEAITKTKIAILESMSHLETKYREEFLIELFKSHANKLQGLLELNEEFRTENLERRLLNILIVLSKGAPKITEDKITYAVIKTTHEELSNIVSANRVNVSIALGSMKDKGLLKLHRGKIDFILN